MREAVARDIFASQFKGRIEVTLPLGRVDVMTDRHLVEVEPVERWREGARQALAYGQMQRRGSFGRLPRRAALAVYGQIPKDDAWTIYRIVSQQVADLDLFMMAGNKWEEITKWPTKSYVAEWLPEARWIESSSTLHWCIESSCHRRSTHRMLARREGKDRPAIRYYCEAHTRLTAERWHLSVPEGES